jgi:hypothetical protein
MIADDRNGVARRVEELLNRGARRAEVTVESLLLKLEANILDAAKNKQNGAVNGAISLMAQVAWPAGQSHRSRRTRRVCRPG